MSYVSFPALVVLSFLFGRIHWAAAQTLNTSLFLLQSATLDVLDRTDKQPGLLDEEAVRGLRANVNQLQKVAANGIEQDAASSYAKVLAHYAALLKRAAQDSDPRDVNEIIVDVAKDIGIKASFTNAALNANATLRGLVNVTVVTIKSEASPASGYLIAYNPRRYADSTPMFVFSNPSSPTSAHVPPGRYDLLAIKGGQIIARQPPEIGLAAEDTTEIVLLVP